MQALGIIIDYKPTWYRRRRSNHDLVSRLSTNSYVSGTVGFRASRERYYAVPELFRYAISQSHFVPKALIYHYISRTNQFSPQYYGTTQQHISVE